MGRKIIYTTLLIVSTQLAGAQQEPTTILVPESFNYKGILSATATLSTGYNTAFKSMNYFLHGYLGYQLDNRIAVRGDIYYFLNSSTKNDPVEPFAFQHNMFTGAEYHFLKSKLDWFAGIQPGLVFGQRQYLQIQSLDGASPLEPPKKTVAACFSFNMGINYYASKFFYLFLETRYNTGWFSDNYSVASLSEVRGSFGLGFYLRVWKPKDVHSIDG
ncbi:MAG TPA: hypothetical protein VD905_11445 [Flavobacteriales bacterium]|nr:hypothetical protein [Flavobacteriales bacterium]